MKVGNSEGLSQLSFITPTTVKGMIDYYETKTQPITKKMVWEAYKEVKSNGGSGGIDHQDLEDYAQNLSGNLYKLWNRLTSGCYFPSPVMEVKIPKKSGGYRGLGIPTINDRIAQQVVKSYLEPKVDGSFHADSYGYRRGKNAHQAIEMAKERCFTYRWVLDIDIKGFFDNIDHELMLKALKCYTDEKWIVMYVERWLKTGIVTEQGKEERKKGTPQGGVISPLLANMYLHFTFDKWIEKYHPHIQFERYCDDIIVHCTSIGQAGFMRREITERFQACNLELNADKTHIVYCKSKGRREQYDKVSFNFLGYTFRPRLWTTKQGAKLLFTPCMSQEAKKAVRDKIRSLALYRFQVPIQKLANILNPMLRGWINYYCKFNKWSTIDIWMFVNERLARWVRANRGFSIKRAFRWLKYVYKTQPNLFVHWVLRKP